MEQWSRRLLCYLRNLLPALLSPWASRPRRWDSVGIRNSLRITIREYVLKKYGLKVPPLYIANIKEKLGLGKLLSCEDAGIRRGMDRLIFHAGNKTFSVQCMSKNISHSLCKEIHKNLDKLKKSNRSLKNYFLVTLTSK